MVICRSILTYTWLKNSTKTIYLMFYLISFIDLKKKKKMLILNWMPACVSNKLGQEQTTVKVLGCSKKTPVKSHSTCKQVHLWQVLVSWVGIKGASRKASVIHKQGWVQQQTHNLRKLPVQIGSLNLRSLSSIVSNIIYVTTYFMCCLSAFRVYVNVFSGIREAAAPWQRTSPCHSLL